MLLKKLGGVVKVSRSLFMYTFVNILSNKVSKSDRNIISKHRSENAWALSFPNHGHRIGEFAHLIISMAMTSISLPAAKWEPSILQQLGREVETGKSITRIMRWLCAVKYAQESGT